MAQYSDTTYLSWDPFDGADRDVYIRARRVKVVTTRKEHKCFAFTPFGAYHKIPVGTRARYEHAIVDGEWGSYYTCLGCMDRWLKEIGVKENTQ